MRLNRSNGITGMSKGRVVIALILIILGWGWYGYSYAIEIESSCPGSSFERNDRDCRDKQNADDYYGVEIEEEENEEANVQALKDSIDDKIPIEDDG